MTEIKPKSVFINGDKELFVSKGAIQRLKNDLRKCDEKNISIEDGKYIKPGYIFDINYRDNNFNVDIITVDEHMRNERKRMLRKKLKNAKYHRSTNVKRDMDSLKRTIPDKLFKSYANLLKQGNFSNIPSPKDVIENPERFQRQISMIMGENGLVSNDEKSNNAIKKYFNTLGNFMGVEPARMNINKTQSEQHKFNETSNTANLEEEVDTEDEEAPELVGVN